MPKLHYRQKLDAHENASLVYWPTLFASCRIRARSSRSIKTLSDRRLPSCSNNGPLSLSVLHPRHNYQRIWNCLLSVVVYMCVSSENCACITIDFATTPVASIVSCCRFSSQANNNTPTIYIYMYI